MNEMEKSKTATILEIKPVKQSNARIWECSPLTIKQVREHTILNFRKTNKKTLVEGHS